MLDLLAELSSLWDVWVLAEILTTWLYQKLGLRVHTLETSIPRTAFRVYYIEYIPV